MSVLLIYSQKELKDMADSYESLKSVIHGRYSEEDDYNFYKSLRRIYYANVACFLCQYHDDTPLPNEDLLSIETIQTLNGEKLCNLSTLDLINRFHMSWSLIKYNLCTNDGETYIAKEAYEYIDGIANRYYTEYFGYIAK